MFKLIALPAENGDCLLIEYGDPKRPCRMLIDTGTKVAYPHLRDKILEIGEKDRQFELMVLTHYDNDHILGALDLFDDNDLKIKYEDVWFNGWPHITDKPEDLLGPREAEIFSHYLYTKKFPWNRSFSGKAAAINQNKPITKNLPSGMKLILISPNFADFKRLREDWKNRLEEIGVEPGVGLGSELPPDVLGDRSPSIDKVKELATANYTHKHTPANQSSIALIAEIENKRFLLAGDASPENLLESIKNIDPGETKFKIDLFKVSHHASKYNTTNELLKKLNCQKYVITTNGKTHHHPDMEGISKIVAFGGNKSKTLFFNYQTEFNKYWNNDTLMNEFEYRTVFGKNGYLEISI